MTTCGNCGETENFVTVQGIIFCGQCGRKVTGPQVSNDEPPPEETGPSEVVEQSDDQQPDIQQPTTSPPKVSNTSNGSTASRLAALKSRRENLNSGSGSRNSGISAVVVNSPEAAPSALKTQRTMSVQGYPAPSSSPESPLHTQRKMSKKKTSHRPNSGSLSAHPNNFIKRRASGIAREVCQTRDGNESVFTLTKSKLGMIETAIRQQVRRETQQQSETDGSILEMEIESIRLRSEAFQTENNELKNTLEEVMIAFQDSLDGTRAKKNEQTAQIGILELEHNQLLTSFEQKDQEFKNTKQHHEQMKVKYDKIMQDNADKIQKLHVTEQELAEWREKYENLKTQASTKIRQAAAAYTGLQSSNLEKDTLTNQLQAENRTLKKRIVTAGTRLEEAKQNKGGLINDYAINQKMLKEKVQQYNEVHNQLSNAIAQYDILKKEAEEIHSINTSYKDQVVHMREEIHKLKIESEHGSKTELGMKRLVVSVQKLQDENRRLKSQLFDHKEIELNLRGQLEGKGVSLGFEGRGSAQIDNYQKELLIMDGQLEVKETENKELMSICEGLMTECETLKQQL